MRPSKHCTTVTAQSGSEHALLWQEALGTDTVPVIGPLPRIADLPGKPGSKVHMLDLVALEQEERWNLADVLGRKFNIEPAEILAEMLRWGCPILADTVSMSCTLPWFL